MFCSHPSHPRILYLRCTKKCGRDQSTLCAAFCLLTSLCDTVGAILARQLTIQVCPAQAWLLFLCGSHTGLCLSPQPTEQFPLGTRALSFLFSQAPHPVWGGSGCTCACVSTQLIITSLKHLKHLFKTPSKAKLPGAAAMSP